MALDDLSMLTPEYGGEERVSVDNDSRSATAYAGTGWRCDPETEPNKEPDTLRFAIAIQQRRDAGDYAGADAIRDHIVADGYEVGTSKGATCVSAGKKCSEFQFHWSVRKHENRRKVYSPLPA